MEICIAVADWARGLTTWVLDVPGGEGTDARRRKRPKHVRNTGYRVSPSGSSGGSITGSTAGSTASGTEAGMVVGWG
ncbi:hypothetical protein GCM10010508_52700 [Streptomyces naganishii JCM 4654]|uniref:Uncharacterized protein n=1 Tax=Streptomyces naganishii JCM 4654 TaxID=1306179 RepID=A0A918Y8P7_9ACTN|nr:hypothetical protein GCM10010508_52700 [Streptomyces naganishii JCM 4654]